VTYRLSEAAKSDLRRIYTFGFKQWGEEAADLYYNNFFDCFERIADNPYLYPSVDEIRTGYRRCICGVDSIYYRIKDETVEIVTIIGRQDTQTLLRS
jgi:toxin ParE1/3/4